MILVDSPQVLGEILEKGYREMIFKDGCQLFVADSILPIQSVLSYMTLSQHHINHLMKGIITLRYRPLLSSDLSGIGDHKLPPALPLARCGLMIAMLIITSFNIILSVLVSIILNFIQMDRIFTLWQRIPTMPLLLSPEFFTK